MDYLANFKLWHEALKDKPEIIKALNQLSEDEKKEAFGKELAFGTGGMRGIMGLGTNRLNEFTLAKTAIGYANYLLKYQKNCKTEGIVICHDNRHNSKEFALEAARIISSFGIKVYLFKELRPTPILSFAIRYLKACGGLMITASHNPKIYNGIKAYNPSGAQLNLIESDQAIAFINKVDDIFNAPKSDDNIEYILDDIDDAYFKELSKIQLYNGKKEAQILYSPLHGTGVTVIPRVLRKLGYNIEIFKDQEATDPDFTNAPSTNPEMELAWAPIVKYAKSKKGNMPDAIILNDPDCDRAGIAIKSGSDYLLLNGNQQAALVLEYVLRMREKNGTLKKDNNVISTIVTTNLLAKIAKKYHQNFLQTLTGFKFIAEEMDKLGGNNKFSFGAEESIGAIIAPYVRDKDAVQLSLMFVEIINYIKSLNLTFEEYFKKFIQDEFGYYLEYTQNVVREGDKGKIIIDKVMDFIRSEKLSFNKHGLLKYDDYSLQASFDVDGKEIAKIDLPKSNVIKFYFDFGWVIFRPSGTEPKLKIYFSVVENSQEDATTLMDNLVSQVYLKIKGIIE